MTLAQLRYAITVANSNSMNEAARNLFISQPSLSSAIRELEEEIGVELFRRTNRGISVTPEGEEFLGYARQVVEQYELIESKYVSKEHTKKKFSVSMQHYTFAVNAFVEMVKQFGMDEYEFAVHETRTYDIITDVKDFKSEIGILYLNDFNHKVLEKLFHEFNLEFHPILECSIYVYMWKGHPLADRDLITLEDLREKGQIVFLDTPGIHKAKNKLGEYMVAVAERTLKEVDAIMWLVEPSTFIGAGERHIAEQLQGVGVPVILIINKIDTVKKEEILPAIDTYRKICDFAEIIPCSALRGQNTEDIIDSILKYLPYGPMFYDEDTVTDQPQRQIVAEVIREKALHALDAEIPHGIAVAIDKMKERPGKNPMVDIEATIICERDSHKGIIIGKGGAMLKKIGSNARFELERMLDSKVNLKLWVKVKKDWRDSDFMIKNFGYDKKEI